MEHGIRTVSQGQSYYWLDSTVTTCRTKRKIAYMTINIETEKHGKLKSDNGGSVGIDHNTNHTYGKDQTVLEPSS